MAKLNIVIADSDEAYLEGLVNYFSSNHLNKFQINCFTKQSYLKDFLLKNNRIDILLLSESLYSNTISMENINTCILLSNGNVTSEFKDWMSINKYQSGDKLYSCILNIYSEHNQDKGVFLQKGSSNTQVICFFSPSGGCGKSVVSLCSSMQCAKMGLKVFYLNMEMFQSTPAFLNCNSENSISQIFYYVKKRSSNISLKIEAAKNDDKRFNIHYFSPPESVNDLEEISKDDVDFLLGSLKNMGIYDVIFVDISSGLDIRSRAVLEKSDKIIILTEQDDLSALKLQELIREFEIISKREGFELLDKITFVLNKYKADGTQNIERILQRYGRNICSKIPKVKAETGLNLSLISDNNIFSDKVFEMIKKVISL